MLTVYCAGAHSQEVKSNITKHMSIFSVAQSKVTIPNINQFLGLTHIGTPIEEIYIFSHGFSCLVSAIDRDIESDFI